MLGVGEERDDLFLPPSPKLKPQSTGRRKQQQVPTMKFFSHLSLQKAHSYVWEQTVLISQAKHMTSQKVSLQTHLNILWHKTIPQLSLFSASLVLTPPQDTMKSSVLYYCFLMEVSPMVDWGVKWGVKPWVKPGDDQKERILRSSQVPREVEPNLCQCGQVAERPDKRSSLGNEMLSFPRK